LANASLVYFTHTDVTGQLVSSLIEELECVGVDVYKHKILGTEIKEGRFSNPTLFERLLESDAIIFASPTYMGGVAAQFKAFADASSEYWSEQMWSGKLAAGLTCGSAPNGDQTATLQYFVTLASQHGMFWVGLDSAYGYKDHGVNRLGCQLGVVAQTVGETANEIDLKTAKYLGRRVAGLLNQLKSEI
jgi:NAD(P)H dehydrogenase (quinone)